jgi:hypothetical protein
VLQIQDGTSNTVLISESTGSTASCSQAPDNDGLVLDSLNLLFREARTGKSVPVVIVILDEIRPSSGVYTIEARIGDQLWDGTMMVRSVGLPGGRTTPAR